MNCNICGFPLIERDGKPWCSVYGRHRPKRKQRIPDSVRRALADRHGCSEVGSYAKVQCAYCDFVGTISRHSWGWPIIGGLEMDHVIPEALGGLTTAENMTLACAPCNRRKGSQIWEPRAT